jgi:hypothetical protein
MDFERQDELHCQFGPALLYSMTSVHGVPIVVDCGVQVIHAGLELEHRWTDKDK